MKRAIGQALAAVLLVSAAEVSADAPTVQTLPIFEAMGGPPTDFAIGKQVGAGTTVLTSPDGLTWTPAAGGLPFNTYKGVAFTGSRLVAVGNNGAVVTVEKP